MFFTVNQHNEKVITPINRSSVDGSEDQIQHRQQLTNNPHETNSRNNICKIKDTRCFINTK